MRIQVLGPGCPNCRTLEARVRRAADGLGLDAQIEKVTEFREIARLGVLATPGLVVDGTVLCSGRVPSEDEVRAWLQGQR